MTTQGTVGATPDFWQTVPAAQARQLGKPRLRPKQYYVAKLDLAGLQKALAATSSAGSADVLLALPLPDGSRQVFRMRTTAVMAPELAARYPQLHTYAGEAPGRPDTWVRLELSATGLRAFVVLEGRTILIEPYRAGDTRHYLCFDKKALPEDSKKSFERLDYR